jgi:hypothetical protein
MRPRNILAILCWLKTPKVYRTGPQMRGTGGTLSWVTHPKIEATCPE